MKTEKQLQGIAGEDLATNLLLQKGYRILERNWHCGHLEVDIIAETDDYLVIVEVKQDGTLPSKFKDFLRDARVKKKGLSKYCLGMLLTEEHLKYNRFKDKIRYVNKLTDKNYKIKSLE